MFIEKIEPGRQVVVLPGWAYETLSRKGKPEDIIDFAKMRQWFTQDQLVAIDYFSEAALSIFWNGGVVPDHADRGVMRETRSAGYTWFFPETHGEATTDTEADKYARNQVSRLAENKAYAKRMVEQYILAELRDKPSDVIDIHQSYSVYSASDKLIVVALNRGVLSPVIFKRKEELRLSILRSVIEKLQEYYDFPVVHRTDWFEWYLTELDCAK